MGTSSAAKPPPMDCKQFALLFAVAVLGAGCPLNSFLDGLRFKFEEP
jgi:hypothetical protein